MVYPSIRTLNVVFADDPLKVYCNITVSILLPKFKPTAERLTISKYPPYLSFVPVFSSKLSLLVTIT